MTQVLKTPAAWPSVLLAAPTADQAWTGLRRAIREQPWVHKDRVKVRHVTTLGMSFDHRIIDGELGSRFLRDVGAFLADPETTLLASC